MRVNLRAELCSQQQLHVCFVCACTYCRYLHARTCAGLPTGAVATAAEQSGDSPASVVTVLIGQAAVQDAGLTVFYWQLQRLIQGLRGWVAMCERQVLHCSAAALAMQSTQHALHATEDSE
jgi:hypothetical protein